MATEEVTFSFGKNWEDFIQKNYSDERVAIAQNHLLGFLERQDLQGVSFLDIGCGSGIHSYAAFRAGAAKITSIDVDPYSVKTTQKIREMAGNPPSWQVLHGSVLDAEFMSSIEPVDLVYSWGVLHHTGDLWNAVNNAATRIKSSGLFYIALYEKTAESDYWIGIKKKYNAASDLNKRMMELAHVYRHFIAGRRPAQLKESLDYIRTYKINRGMSFMTDIRDWLGGWPYEPSTPEEVTDFCVNKLGLLKQKIQTGEANIEYLFQKK